MGPTTHEDDDHAAHAAARRRGRRPHAGADGHLPGRARSSSSSSASRRSTTAAPRPSGRSSTAAATRPTPPAPARRFGCRPTCKLGDRGQPGPRPAHAQGRRAGLRRARLGRGARRRRMTSMTPSGGSTKPSVSGVDWLEPGAPVRRPSLARGDPALGADDQGTDLHADRGDRGRADHLAAGDPGRRAQLGLPLHVDARLDVHAAGAAPPRTRLGGGRVHAVRRRPRAQQRRRPADHVRDRRSPRPDRDASARISPGYSGAHPVRIGNGAFDQRQNDVFGAVLDSILKHTMHSQRLPRRLWPIVQAQAECATNVWRQPDQGIWEARGKPQHYVSSKLMCWVAMDRAAKLAAIRDDPELAGQRGRPPRRRSTPTSSSTGSRRACCASTTTPRRWTPRRCWRRSSASSPAMTSACTSRCSRSPTT